MTKRPFKQFWTEVKRVCLKDGKPEVKQTTCCCKDPGESRRDCMIKAGHKNPCRCYCHKTGF